MDYLANVTIPLIDAVLQTSS
ncbi:hypothetical protein AGR8A_Cc30183 [Agrobacterium fabrum str. J-07]|nr:hypothetical protein AGR8A_Cc30183 [Agrobacterium fabrum str. J-07]